MNRRDFLKMAGYAGMGLTLPLFPRGARAQAEGPYTGTFWVMVHAGGGWDPTSLCDPKGRANEMEEDPMNMYFTADIGQAGNIRYAPVAGNDVFFQKHYQQLTVINGVDTQTNGHDSGTRHIWSGKLQEGHPAFSALVAGVHARTKPLAYISNGGYENTMGLVAPTRAGNTGVLDRIAHPNRFDPADVERQYHTTATMDRIKSTMAARNNALMDRQKLPRLKSSISTLGVARTGENEIARVTEFLPELDTSNNQLKRQAQFALAAYKAGVSASANLTIGGFDTHGNHDQNHFPRLQMITEGVDFLIEEATRQGVHDKLGIIIGSDFGRTPGYNGQNGKDHWSITSVMLWGPGIGIPGNRVVGETDARHVAKKVNPTTLTVDEANGLRINPGHIHKTLRKLAGVDSSEQASLYPISSAELPLLG